MQDLLDRYECLNVALAERDAYTESHCGRVVGLCIELGRMHALSENELGLLGIAARFHDIGKIGVPDAVLLKPGPLDASERRLIESHAELGERICRAIPHAEMEIIARIVRHHHEGFDGSGYPDALAGESIPLPARILAIADSYDAMATARPYHRARSHAEVMRLMREENGNKFDPALFAGFEQLIASSRYKASPQA